MGNPRTGGFLGLELKFLDCAWNAVTIATSTAGADGEMPPSSGCTNAISVPGQGDGEQQRDGRKYVIKSAWVSGQVNLGTLVDQADVSVGRGYFFALVLDTQTNAAVVVSENVYLNPSTDVVAMLPQPLRNLANSKRFRILATQTVLSRDTTVGTDGTNTQSVASVPSMVNLSWKGSIEVNCVGTTADVASVSDNSLSILAYAGSTNFTPVFTGKSRVRFMG